MAEEKKPEEPQEQPSNRAVARFGEPDTKQWQEGQAVTGRPADEVPDNSTFAARAKEREQSEKRMSASKSENKAVKTSEAKRR